MKVKDIYKEPRLFEIIIIKNKLGKYFGFLFTGYYHLFIKNYLIVSIMVDVQKSQACVSRFEVAI